MTSYEANYYQDDSQKITFFFMRPKRLNPVSWLIMKLTKVPYSHVVVSWYSSSIARTMMYEAYGTGTRFFQFGRYMESHIAVEALSLWASDVQRMRIIQFCVDNCGAPYGVKTLIGAALKLLRITKRNPFADGQNSYECVELASYVAQILFGREIKDKESMTQKEFRDLLIENGAK